MMFFKDPQTFTEIPEVIVVFIEISMVPMYHYRDPEFSIVTSAISMISSRSYTAD